MGLVALIAAPPAAAVSSEANPPSGANDFSCKPSAVHPRPIVLVHGLSANMQLNWSYLAPKLKERGYCVFALTYGLDPRISAVNGPGGVIPIEQSSAELNGFVGPRALVDRLEQGRPRRPLGGHLHAAVLAEVRRRRGQGRPLRGLDVAVRRDHRRRGRQGARPRRGPRVRPADHQRGREPVRLVSAVHQGIAHAAQARRGRGGGAGRHLHDGDDQVRRAGHPLHERDHGRARPHQPRAAGHLPARRVRAPRRGGGPGGRPADLQRARPARRAAHRLQPPAAVDRPRRPAPRGDRAVSASAAACAAIGCAA